MIGIKIVDKSGNSFNGSVKKLGDVYKIAEYSDIALVYIFAITPREFAYFSTVVNSNKIKVLR